MADSSEGRTPSSGIDWVARREKVKIFLAPREKIKESWALLDPPSSVEELLTMLDNLLTCVLKIETWEYESYDNVFAITMDALVSKPLLTHSNVHVKVSVALCLTQLARMSAPYNPLEPYEYEEDIKEAFKLIVSTFQNLDDTSSRSYSKRLCILRTFARIRLWILLLDLDCEPLVINMLEIFFKVIRDYHPNSVFSSMENIFAGVIEYLSLETLEVILKSLREDDDKPHKLSRRRLAESVLSHFGRESDFQPYLSGVVASSDVSIREYSSRLHSMLGWEPIERQFFGNEQEDKQIAAGTNAPKDESGGESGVSNGVAQQKESWIDTASRKRQGDTNAKDDPQNLDNLSNTDLNDTWEEKPDHAGPQIKEKGKTPCSVKKVDSDIKEETEPEAFMDRKNVLSSSPDDSSAISCENEKKTSVQALPSETAADKTPIVNFPFRAEDILEDQILDSWALLDPPSSVDDLLAILDKFLDTLSNVKVSDLNLYWFALSRTRRVLVRQEFLYHSDVDVKVAVAACLSQIIRITALDHPYDNERLKELFQVIISSFENLDDISSRSYSKRIFILETVAKAKLWDVIINFGCGALFSEMFTNFLKYIRDHHPSNVFSSMTDIMSSVLVYIPEPTLPPILTYVREDYEVPRVSRKLAEKVLSNCASNSKFKPYLTTAVESSGVSSFKYSSIVRAMLEGPSSDMQQDQLVGNGKEDKQKAAGTNAPKDESGGKSRVLNSVAQQNKSWIDTESRKRHDDTNAEDEPQRLDNLSNADLTNSCEEKAYVGLQIKEKGKDPSCVKQMDSDTKEETEPEAVLDRKDVLSSSPDVSSVNLAISYEIEKKTSVLALPPETAADETPLVLFPSKALGDQNLDGFSHCWGLLNPPSSVDELLPLLDRMFDTLSKVKLAQFNLYWFALCPTMKALLSRKLLYHSDVDVKVAVAACLSEVLRITDPHPPYHYERLKEALKLFVSSFKNLDDKSSRSYSKRICILGTFAKVKSLEVMMVKLNCGALSIEMFDNFLKAIRDHHPSNVFFSMEVIMTRVLECFPEETLQPILTYVRQDCEVPQVSRRLSEKVLSNCVSNSKFKPYLSRAVESSGVSLGKYSSIVRLILEGPYGDLQQDQLVGNGKEDIEDVDACFFLLADAPQDESGASTCDEASFSETKALPPQAYRKKIKSETYEAFKYFTYSMPKEEKKKLGRRLSINSICLWSLCIYSVYHLFSERKRGRF